MDERESHGCEVRMQLVGDGVAVASCPMRRGAGWLLARCGAAVASRVWRRGHTPQRARGERF